MKHVLTLLILTTSFAAAQQSVGPADNQGSPVDPALNADIRRLMDDVGTSKMMKQMFDQSLGPMLELMKGNPNLTPEFVDEFAKRIRVKMLNGHMEDIIAQEYAKLFTRDEIRQILAYQESPVGRKAASVMPQLMTDLHQQLGPYGRQMGQEVASEIVREHPEYVRKPQAATPGPRSGGAVGGVLGGASISELGKDAQRLTATDQEARITKKVSPVYPPLAKSARVQGTVNFNILVARDGTVEQLELISGHPLLVNAAREAVLQWVYEPLIVNGQAVKVITNVHVDFSLSSAQ